MKQIHKIKPKQGLSLRFPGMKRFLNELGEFVEWNSFWERRLNQGDVEIVSTMQEEKAFLEELAPKNKKKSTKDDKGVES